MFLLFVDSLSLIKISAYFQFVNSILSDGNLLVTLIFQDGFSVEFEKGFKILLCHRPEYYDRFVKETDIDLVLSGHNHGGQFRLFGKGLISSSSGLFPKYDRGIFENRLVISAGCSNRCSDNRNYT